MRQKDQTGKKATGNFDRDGLLTYLEKEAMEYKDRDDVVPFTGERKGVCVCVCVCVSVSVCASCLCVLLKSLATWCVCAYLLLRVCV